MEIIEITDRDSLLIEQLLNIWESSVRATHLFLSAKEIDSIKQYVPRALREVPHLLAVKNEKEIPVGFMGIAEHRLEMLFISASERGKGLGKELLKYGMDTYSVTDLAVNEHMGFEVYKRTELDEQGNPYPLLYMRRKV